MSRKVRLHIAILGTASGLSLIFIAIGLIGYPVVTIIYGLILVGIGCYGLFTKRGKAITSKLLEG